MMNYLTEFLDGPAVNQVLDLLRNPIFLRAVHDPLTGKWDALDQLTDEALPDEEIVVYRRVHGDHGVCHVDRTVKGRRVGEWYQIEKYRVLQAQPADSLVRDNSAWQKWTQKEYARENEEKAADRAEPGVPT